ncbi:MAG: hypothetical protein FWG03_03610 [Clostridiales bacterium]|nr:hypothetical protein [Clostridiales bacterium]
MDANREDIYEQDELEKMVDITGLPYEGLQRLCVSFINDELLTAGNMKKLGIGSEAEKAARHYMHQAGEFFIEGAITKELLREERISCWTEHDKYSKECLDKWRETGENNKSSQQDLFRLIVCCLYADWDECGMNCEYDAGEVLGLYFDCLADLGSGYCRQLRFYLQERLMPAPADKQA